MSDSDMSISSISGRLSGLAQRRTAAAPDVAPHITVNSSGRLRKYVCNALSVSSSLSTIPSLNGFSILPFNTINARLVAGDIRLVFSAAFVPPRKAALVLGVVYEWKARGGTAVASAAKRNALLLIKVLSPEGATKNATVVRLTLI